MEPQSQPSDSFKGDADSVANTIEAYLKYLGKLGNMTFDINFYTHWRFIENKVNSHRFFLPLVDAVIIDLYVHQNLQISSQQGFSLGLENYIVFKDSVRQSLTMLDPYLITCSFTQTPPSYQGYYDWTLFQQSQEGKMKQIQKFREQLVGLNTVTFRQDVFGSYVFDPNNKEALTVGGYQKHYANFVQQEKTVEDSYDVYMEDLRKSIEGINLFVFNDFVEAIERAGGQATKQGYTQYYGQVLKKYDEDYLKTKHEQVLEEERAKKEKDEKLQGNKKEKAVDMDEDEEDLADQLQDVEQNGYTNTEVEGQALEGEQLDQKAVDLKLQQAKKCACCKGNVYECKGEVCQMLGNCVCLSE